MAGERNKTPTECISQKYLELSGVIFIVINADQKVALINKKGCDLLGYSKHEIVGKNWFDNFLPERSRAVTKAGFLKLISGKVREVGRFENPILTKKGEERLIAWTNSVLRSRDGRIISTISAGEDITRHRKSEEAVRESEEKYHTLVNQSLEGIIIAQGPAPRIAFANPALARMLGYTVKELISLTPEKIAGLVHPDDREMFFGRFRDRLQGKPAPSFYQFRGVRKDGKSIWLAISSNRIMYEGKPAVQAAFTDITRHRKAEEALKESEAKFRTLVESSQDVVMLTRADGTVSYLSPACKKVLGWEPDSLVGTRPNIFHPEDAPKVRQALASALKGKSGADLQYRVITKKGEVRWISHSWSPVMLHGKLRMVASMVHDITERNKNEDALNKMNRTLKLLTESDRLLIKAEDEQGLLQGICDLIVEQGGYRMAWFGTIANDREKSILPVAHAGIEDGFLNNSKFSWGENKWGCGPSGIAIRSGRPCFAGNIAKDPKYAPWRNEAIKRGYASFISLPLIFEEKSIGILNIYSSTPNAFNAEEIALLDELANDIAYGIIGKRVDEEHRKLEELKRDYTFKLESDVRSRTKDLLEQKRKAEALTEMKDRFIRDIGHELKTPLSVILGNLVLLKEIAPAGKERQWSKLLDMMDRSANRLGTSINKMLQLYKLTQTEARRERVYLKEMLADIYNEYLPLAKMKELELRVESRPAVIIGDGELLQLALSNLVSNAIKFTDRGSVLVELKPSVESVSISVSDTGKGLSRESKKKLFEKFFKVDPSAPGTGIGLTITKEIVEKHKGELKVDSKLGEGSTFTLILPRGVQNE